MKRDKVILVSRDLSVGGAEKQIALLTRYLHKDTYLFLYQAKTSFDWKGNFVSINMPTHPNFLIRVILPIPRALQLAKLRAILKPRAVISFAPHTNLVNILSGLLSRSGKTVISVRTHQSVGLEVLGSYGRAYRIALKTFSRFADALVSPTQNLADDFCKNFNFPKEKAFVIPNICDLDEVKQKAEVENEISSALEGEKFVVSVGRLIPQKNFERLLKAFSFLANETNLRLVIVGDGPLREKLIRMAQGIAETCSIFDENKFSGQESRKAKIIFTGELQNPYPILKRAWAFVLSSSIEGFPNVLLEAMALGIPSVATVASDGVLNALGSDKTPSQIVLGQAGILVNPCDDGKLLARAIKMLEDEKLYKKLSERARKRVKLFEPQKIVKKWDEFINSL